jgi:regulation of enolase protein 1 (concanavalin A-like superfamily)
VRTAFASFALSLALAVLAAAPAAAQIDDEFDGTTLDTARWDRSHNLVTERLEVSGGMLRIETANGDIDGPNPMYPGPIENLVLQAPRAGDWTVETKVHAPLGEHFQLAGFILYSDDNHYVKYDVVADNAPGSERDLRVELRKEEGGPLTPPDGVSDLDPPVSATDTWWLRLTKQGDTYSGAISADGQTWETTPGTVTVALTDPALGLMAVGPDQTSSITAAFDYFREVVDDPDAPTTTAALDPAQPGPGGLYDRPVTVTLNATDGDGSGVALTEYRIDGGAFTAYQSPFTVSASGRHEIEFRSTDEVGNVEAVKSVVFTILPGAGVVPGGGAPPPTGGGTPPPVDDEPASFQLARLPRTTLAQLRQRGLRVRVTCTAAMTGSASLKVTRGTARRLRLGSTTTLARESIRCAGAGSRTVTLKPSAKAKRALRRARGNVKATLAVGLRAPGEPASTTTRRVTFARG